MKRRHRLLFALVLLLCSPVVFCSVAFAADNPWVNEIIGFDGESVSSGYIVQWSGSEFVWRDPVPESNYKSGGFPLFNQTLPYHDHKTTDFLKINQPSIFLPVDGYDIYYATVVRSMSGLSPGYQGEFSFYPLTAKLYTVDGDHEGYDAVNVSKVTHTDSQFIDADRLNMGFSAVWKLPDNLENNAVSYVEFTAPSGSMINGNSVFNNYIIYIPSGSAVAESAQAIVDAIDNQTAGITGALADQTDQLMAVPDEQVQAAEQFVNDSNAQLQEALSPLMAAEQLSGSLVNAFRSKEKYQVYFPGVAGPFMPDGSTVTIIQPQTVDMSFMDRFSIITDAIGVVMLGLCGWKTLDFLYNTLMKILGKDGDES